MEVPVFPETSTGLRILFLSTWHPWPADNGSRIRVSQLLQSLAARHEVNLVTFSGEQDAPDAAALVGLGLCRRAIVLDQPAFSAPRLRRWLGLLAPMPRQLFATRSPEMERAARSLIASRAPDLIIASTTAVADLATRLPVRHRVLEEHNFLGRMMRDGYDSAQTPFRRARTWATWRKDIAWERGLFRHFDLVTMVSEADRTAVHTMGCATTRVEVVPNGVDAEACSAVKAESMPDTVIYPGALTYSANLEAVDWFARQVWPQVKAKRPHARFLVTGKTHGVDTRALADVPGLILTGYLSDVRPTLAAAQVAVIPLLQGGGSRLKVLEAMALGVPVLSTSKGIGGLDVIVDRHCLIADEPAHFAAQLDRLMGDEDLCLRLAQAALAEVVPRYDWPPISARFVDLVEAVAEE